MPVPRKTRNLILGSVLALVLACAGAVGYFTFVFAASGTEIVNPGTVAYYLMLDGDIRRMPMLPQQAGRPQYLYSSGDVDPPSTALVYCARAKAAEVEDFYRSHFEALRYSSQTAEPNTLYFSRQDDRLALEIVAEPVCSALVRIHHFHGTSYRRPDSRRRA